MSRLNRECMICHTWIDGVHSCFIPVNKNDRLELTGCEQCLKDSILKIRDENRMSLDEMRKLLGLIEGQ